VPLDPARLVAPGEVHHGARLAQASAQVAEGPEARPWRWRLAPPPHGPFARLRRSGRERMPAGLRGWAARPSGSSRASLIWAARCAASSGALDAAQLRPSSWRRAAGGTPRGGSSPIATHRRGCETPERLCRSVRPRSSRRPV